MSYSLAVEKKGDILWVTATGTRSREGVLAMTKEILMALTANQVTKVLIDVRALAGRLGTLDSYDVVDKHFPAWRDRRVITCCSIVDLKEYESGYKFFENLAANRGFALRIFSDTGKAFAWLQQEKLQ